ncbi:MAG: GxxExxY protein [Pirellulales bacterium]
MDVTIKETKMEFDELSNRVIGCAIEVHRHLGPGLLESAYEQCLANELSRNSIAFQLQLPQPVQYKGVLLDCGYRIDVLIENRLIIELKSVEKLLGIHEAQLLTYMRLADVKIGLLINFNVTKLKEGIKRLVL